MFVRLVGARISLAMFPNSMEPGMGSSMGQAKTLWPIRAQNVPRAPDTGAIASFEFMTTVTLKAIVFQRITTIKHNYNTPNTFDWGKEGNVQSRMIRCFGESFLFSFRRVMHACMGGNGWGKENP